MVRKEHRSIMVGCILSLVLGSIWIFKDVMFQSMFSYKKIGERTHYSGFSDDSLFSGEGTYNSGDREDVDLVTLINDALHSQICSFLSQRQTQETNRMFF